MLFFFLRNHNYSNFINNFFFCFNEKLYFFLCRILFIYYIKIQNFFLDKDETLKFQFLTYDFFFIETVVIKKIRNSFLSSICISTQLGCVVGCKFCSVSKLKFLRNLLCSEILFQIYNILYFLFFFDFFYLSNLSIIKKILFMGVGEPLNNYNNLLDSILILNSKFSLNILQKDLIVSTSGVINNIYKLLKDSKVTINISLNHSSNKSRKLIVPLANKYNIFNIQNIFNLYSKIVTNRLTFSYVLISQINDSFLDLFLISIFFLKNKTKLNLIFFNKNYFSFYENFYFFNFLFFKNFLKFLKIQFQVRNVKGYLSKSSCGSLSYDYIYRKRYF